MQTLDPLQRAHGAVAAYAFTALCLLMPLTPNLLPLLLIAGTLGLVVHHRPWRMRVRVAELWGTALPYAFLLFVLHVFGLAWSRNFAYAGFDLQIKAPLLVLPLVALLLPRDDGRAWRVVGRSFIAGNAVAVLVCVAAAVWRVMQGAADPGQEVFGERFSFLVHPSYFALYLTFALVLLFLDEEGSDVRWRLTAGAVLCLGVVLCGSKMGWALLPMVLITVLVRRWRDRAVRSVLAILIGTSLIGGGVLIAGSAGVRDRLAEAWRSMAHGERHQDASTSSEVRKLAWDGATDVIAANAPWGTGTGDVKDELIATYARKGYVHLVEKRINAHSEYLQIAAALGWPGLLLVLAVVLVPFVAALRGGQVLAALFFGLNAVNWAVESMLEVQAGVLFFVFFAFVLAQHRPRPSHTDPNTA